MLYVFEIKVYFKKIRCFSTDGLVDFLVDSFAKIEVF